MEPLQGSVLRYMFTTDVTVATIMEPFQGSVLRRMFTTDVTVATIMEPFQGWGFRIPAPQYYGRHIITVRPYE